MNCLDHSSPVISEEITIRRVDCRQFRLPKAGAVADPLPLWGKWSSHSQGATPVLLCESAIAVQWVALPSAFPISHSCRKQEGRGLIRKTRCQYYILCMTPRHYTSDATSHIDRAYCFGVVMGGERERGVTEGTQCQILLIED